MTSKQIVLERGRLVRTILQSGETVRAGTPALL
jgi:hypothetical protein